MIPLNQEAIKPQNFNHFKDRKTDKGQRSGSMQETNGGD